MRRSSQLFDPGTFTVGNGMPLIMEKPSNSVSLREHPMAYHGRPIRDAQHSDWRPETAHLAWHGREMFEGEPRHRS